MYDKTVYSWSLADMTRHLDPHNGGGLLQRGTHVRTGIQNRYCWPGALLPQSSDRCDIRISLIIEVPKPYWTDNMVRDH